MKSSSVECQKPLFLIASSSISVAVKSDTYYYGNRNHIEVVSKLAEWCVKEVSSRHTRIEALTAGFRMPDERMWSDAVSVHGVIR